MDWNQLAEQIAGMPAAFREQPVRIRKDMQAGQGWDDNTALIATAISMCGPVTMAIQAHQEIPLPEPPTGVTP